MEYQPLTEFSTTIPQLSPTQLSQRRCKSASHATLQNGYLPSFVGRAQTEPECISLPGQINLDNALANDGIKQSAKYLATISNTSLPLSEGDSLAQCEVNIEETLAPEEHDLRSRDIAQTPPRKHTSMELEHSSLELVENSQVNHHINDLEIQEEHRIISAISNDITKLDDDQSYLSGVSAFSSTHSPSYDLTKSYQQSAEAGQSNSPRVRTKPLRLALYVLCAVVVYPILLPLVPFLLIFKLASLLCCCVPCHRHKRHKTQTAIKQELPLFFTSCPGGYHTIGIELQERMDGEIFVEYVISKLNNVYCHDSTMKQSIVYRLASIIQQIACFSWLELGENVRLEEHIQIVRKRITTTTNFTDFIEQISKNLDTAGHRKKLWRLYYFPFFKTNGSSILLQVHNSLLTGVDLKDILLKNFSDSAKSSRRGISVGTTFSHPTLVETVLIAPGVVLKHLLRPSLTFHQMSTKHRFVYSSPMHLSEANRIANQCNVSLHALFMAPLSQSLQNLFSQKYSSRSVKIAIPIISSCRHNSTFFVNLPLTSQTWDSTRLQNLNGDIYHNSKDSYVLLSAAKFASLTLSPCTIDFLASLVLRQADVLFDIVHCPTDPHYLENSAISSVMYWPPLFNQISMGVYVVVYEQSFRVCVVTNYSVTDWPDILLKLYIASYSELYKTLST